MAALTGTKPKDTYKDLLQVSNSNSGIDATVRQVSDGEATGGALYLGSGAFGLGSNGDKLQLDADGDTYLVASGDDAIDWYVAGAADFTLSANLFAALDGSSVVVGHTALIDVSGTSGLQVLGTGAADSAAVFARFAADANAPALRFLKSRNAAIGSNTLVQDNDSLGAVSFFGDDGTDLNTEGARISARVNGTPAANDMPTELVFAVTAALASTPTERFYISQDGGMYANGAAGGSQGAGTGNFEAVYDDGVDVTCYVLEAWQAGTIDQAKWDAIVPDKVFRPEVDDEGNVTNPGRRVNRTHTKAASFSTVAQDRLSVRKYTDFIKANRHLPAFPSFADYQNDPSLKLGIGDISQRLWETVELQAVHISELLDRVEALEA